MAAIVACIAGEEIHRQSLRTAGKKLGPRKTPFGPSGEIFLVDQAGAEFYLMPRYGIGMAKTAPHRVNYRANIYALKDLGVRCVLGWGPAGAITHNISVGDLVIASDLIDMTSQRPRTFFDNSPLGYLRQFPVFCPALRAAVAGALLDMKLVHHPNGIAAVCEGPRLETPAEVRMLETIGAEVVTHTFVPEMFLARELELCYAAVCYVVNYAETGSRHRPFAAGELFAGLTSKSDSSRLAGAVAAMTEVARRVAQAAAAAPTTGPSACDCAKTQAYNIKTHNLPADWHDWFK